MSQGGNKSGGGSGLVPVLDESSNSLVVRRTDESMAFGPLVCRVHFRRVSEKAHDVVSSVAGGWSWRETELATPLGSGFGFRGELAGVPGLPARILWEIARAGEEELLARVMVENQDRHALKVFEMCPIAYRGADPGLEMGAGYLTWRFFRTGYQSWSPAGSVGVMDPDFQPRFFLPSRSGLNPRTPYSRRPGEKAADWMAQVVEPKLRLGLLLGFVTSAEQASRVEFEVRYDRFRRLEAVSDGEGRVIDPGEAVGSEWCLLSLSRDPLAQQAAYFDRWAAAMKARSGRPLSGWESWYFSFGKVSEEIVRHNLKALAEFRGLLDTVQIDDGFERWVGEWLPWNEKFPTPPATLAAQIRREGFTPGLWLAPFLVSHEAPLYKRHPDWALRNARGRPVTAFVHPQWKGHVMYALDATHPGVRNWLRETVKTVVSEWGFKFLKLDFLYAASLPGVRYDRKATGASALRQGLAVIREAAGEEAYILGCGCPLGPAVGMVDAMRVSQDIDIRWKLPVMDSLSGAPVGPGARNCLRNDLNRLLMHRRLWVNDPDCVVLRQTRGGMKPHELQSMLTVYYLTGGMTMLSEDLPALPPDRLAWFFRLIPPSGEAALPLDLFSRDFPETLLLKKKHSALLAIFNWSEESRERKILLSDLGLAGRWLVFDFWAERFLGVVEEELAAGPVPAHGCKYLRLVEEDNRPRLLAMNLHMGMGEAGVETQAEENRLLLRLRLPGARRGKLWAVFPGAAVVEKEVIFTDGWEGEIAAQGGD